MTEKEKLTKQVFKILKLTFPHLPKPRLEVMAQVIVAFFSPDSMRLREIASRLPGDTAVKHKLKRLQYFLDRLELDREFWKGYVKTIFILPHFRLMKRRYITLLIDVTTLRDDFWILSASVSYMGRSIPIYMKVWRGVNESYDYWGRVREFMKGLSEVLPRGHRYEIVYEVVADRGFQGVEMWEICKEVGMEYVTRINGSYKVRVDSRDYIQLTLFEDGYYEAVILGKSRPYRTNIVVRSVEKEEGGRLRWYIATSLRDGERAVRDYERRVWIEESFKDLKEKLGWERYTRKVPRKRRMEGLIAISALSYAIQMSIGRWVEVPRSEERKMSILSRFQSLVKGMMDKLERYMMKLVNNVRVKVWAFEYKLSKMFG